MFDPRRSTVLAAAALALAVAATPSAHAQRATLAITDVKISQPLESSITVPSQRSSLKRVAAAMDTVLVDRFNATRKFELITRSDLDTLMKEQGLQNSGIVDTDDPNTAKQFLIKGARYMAVTTIVDYQDIVERASFEGLEETAVRRTLRYTAAVKLWDTTRGTLKESSKVTVKKRMTHERKGYVTQQTGEFTDELIQQIADELGQLVTNRVVEVIYPARVLVKRDGVVTINRGDGTGIAIGQVWKAYALGEELIDFDTGESLGREEVEVGSVRVTQITPKFSKAQVIDDLGIDRGAVLRLVPPAE